MKEIQEGMTGRQVADLLKNNFSEVSAEIDSTKTMVADEEERAKDSEKVLEETINAEKERAEEAEMTLAAAIAKNDGSIRGMQATLEATTKGMLENSDEIKRLNTVVLGNEEQEIGLEGVSYKGVIATGSTSYSGGDETKYKHQYVRVAEGSSFTLISNGAGTTAFGFVKSVGVTGDVVDLCNDEEVRALTSGETLNTGKAPADVKYLCVNTMYGGVDITPRIVQDESEGKIKELEADIEKVKDDIAERNIGKPEEEDEEHNLWGLTRNTRRRLSEVEEVTESKTLRTDIKQELGESERNMAINNLGIKAAEELQQMFSPTDVIEKEVVVEVKETLDGKFIAGANATISENSGYAVKVYDVGNATRVIINGTNTYEGVDNPRAYAFYSDAELTTKVGDAGTNIPALSYEFDMEVPEGAAYLACCINKGRGGEVNVSALVTVGTNTPMDTLSSKAVRGDIEQKFTVEEKDTALKSMGIAASDELREMFNPMAGEAIEVEIDVKEIKNGYFIAGSAGTIMAYTGYDVLVYDIGGLDKVTVRGSNSLTTTDNSRAYAFYSDENLTTKVGDTGPVIPASSYTFELDVPEGASYLACCVNPGRAGEVKAYKEEVVAGKTLMKKLKEDVEFLKSSGVGGDQGGYGLYKQGTDYYHFCKRGGKTIIRKFKQEGPNSLFQLSQIAIGKVSSSGVAIDEIIQTCGTDNVGPVSLYNTSLFSGYGEWSGGYHSKTVDGVACPTAEQISLSVRVNGTEVTSNGLYYGVVTFKCVNKLYFPQSITSSDLSTATQVLEETRDYVLDDKMTVKVKMQAKEDFYVSCYYGMQAVTLGFDNIFLPNNMKEFTIPSLTETLWLTKPERKMYMNSGNLHYDLTLKDVGCGQFDSNAKLFGMFAKGRYKAYFMCFQDASKAKELDSTQSAKKINKGEFFGWEGVYDVYYD